MKQLLRKSRRNFANFANEANEANEPMIHMGIERFRVISFLWVVENASELKKESSE